MRGALAFAVAAGLASWSFAGDMGDRRGTFDPTPPDNTTHNSVPTEDFAVVPPAGWTINNQSANASTALTSWFQGNSAVFSAQSGAPTSYAGANFNNTTGTNTISDWLISPQFNLSAGDVVHFWTRTVTTPAFPDRLQLRFSPTGGGNPGVGPTSTGDFSVLLTDINPTYSTAGYPSVWTEFTAAIPSNAPTGRLAFRYFVENGGPSGANSDYIGVDTFSVVGGVTPEPASVGLLGVAGAMLARRRRA